MTLPRNPETLRAWRARSRPLGRSQDLTRTGFTLHVVPDSNVVQFPAPKAREPINPVSTKRARENRERAAMADRLWPDRREGTVMCAVPWCPRLADDLHEPLTRARGGSITDEDNAEPLCRQHNHDLAQKPESQLGWAYDLKLLRHSWEDAGLLKHSWGDEDPDGGSAA